MSLEVRCFPAWIQNENTYLITDRDTGWKAVIDPGYYGEDVKNEIGEGDSLKFILLTHGHFDHFAAIQEYIDEYPSAVFAAPLNEEYLLHGGRDNKWLALGHGSSICPEADRRLKEGDTVTLGGTVLKVIETPGHTKGGICFFTGTEVFTGDTLFRLSVGNSSLETGSKDELIRSIQDRLYSLSDDVIVWPGHGPATTIGYEKRNNPFVQGKDFI